MKRRLRISAAGMLVLLATALIVGIAYLHGWGGRVETQLMVFGERVWVTLDAGRPRVFLLMALPVVLLGAAVSLYPRRSGDSGE